MGRPGRLSPLHGPVDGLDSFQKDLLTAIVAVFIIVRRFIAAKTMDARLRRLLTVQLLLIASAYVVFLVTTGRSTADPVWFGGAIAVSNVGLLARCARRRINQALDAARQTLWVAYSCAVTRFVAVAALFMLGMGILKLHPLAILMGFISGQLVLFFPQTRKLIS